MNNTDNVNPEVSNCNLLSSTLNPLDRNVTPPESSETQENESNNKFYQQLHRLRRQNRHLHLKYAEMDYFRNETIQILEQKVIFLKRKLDFLTDTSSTTTSSTASSSSHLESICEVAAAPLAEPSTESTTYQQHNSVRNHRHSFQSCTVFV